jgi:hypothetical protein
MTTFNGAPWLRTADNCLVRANARFISLLLLYGAIISWSAIKLPQGVELEECEKYPSNSSTILV